MEEPGKGFVTVRESPPKTRRRFPRRESYVHIKQEFTVSITMFNNRRILFTQHFYHLKTKRNRRCFYCPLTANCYVGTRLAMWYIYKRSIFIRRKLVFKCYDCKWYSCYSISASCFSCPKAIKNCQLFQDSRYSMICCCHVSFCLNQSCYFYRYS